MVVSALSDDVKDDIGICRSDPPLVVVSVLSDDVKDDIGICHSDPPLMSGIRTIKRLQKAEPRHACPPRNDYFE